MSVGTHPFAVASLAVRLSSSGRVPRRTIATASTTWGDGARPAAAGTDAARGRVKASAMSPHTTAAVPTSCAGDGRNVSLASVSASTKAAPATHSTAISDEPAAPEPRRLRAVRDECLRKRDRRADAADHVAAEEREQHRGAGAERRDQRRLAQVVPVRDVAVVGAEQRLVDEARLHEPEREPQQQHRRPAAPAAARRLADQHGRRAVQRTEDHEAEDQRCGAADRVVVADEVLGADGREQKQHPHRSEAGPAHRGWRSAGCARASTDDGSPADAGRGPPHAYRDQGMGRSRLGRRRSSGGRRAPRPPRRPRVILDQLRSSTSRSPRRSSICAGRR